MAAHKKKNTCESWQLSMDIEWSETCLQSWQVLLEFAPTAPEKVPLGHTMQLSGELDPTTEENVPFMQGWHPVRVFRASWIE
jgi:hypothetical protein